MRVGLLGLTVCGLATLSACSGSSGAPTATPEPQVSTVTVTSSPPASASAPATLLCAPSNTTVTFTNAQGAAGTEFVQFRVKNTGHRPCHTYGYPGFQLWDRDGRRLPTHVERLHDRTPRTHLLAPGESAIAESRYYGADQHCDERPGARAFSVTVTLPDNTASDRVSVTGNGMEVTPCRGRIMAEPIYTA